MKYRNAAEWGKIIADQCTSGLNVATYCRQQGINAKTFSSQKQKHGHQSRANSFMQVAINSGNEAISKPSLIITHRSNCLEFSELPPSIWLAQVLKASL